MANNLNEQDLNGIINDHLNKCKDYANVCTMLQTPAGRKRIFERVKELILNDGITDVESAIAHVESELIFSE